MFVQTQLHISHLCVYGLETRWEMWLSFSVRVCLLSKCIWEYMSAGILQVNSNMLLHLSFLAPDGDALLHRNLKVSPSWWCEPCPQSSTKYFPNMEQSCHFFKLSDTMKKFIHILITDFILWETASLEAFLWSQNCSFAFREWTWAISAFSTESWYCIKVIKCLFTVRWGIVRTQEELIYLPFALQDRTWQDGEGRNFWATAASHCFR